MIKPTKQWLRNRDFILVSAVVCGLIVGRGASWSQQLVLPALAVVMTLSTMGVRSEMLRSPRDLRRRPDENLKRAAKLLENTNLLSNLTQEKEKAT